MCFLKKKTNCHIILNKSPQQQKLVYAAKLSESTYILLGSNCGRWAKEIELIGPSWKSWYQWINFRLWSKNLMWPFRSPSTIILQKYKTQKSLLVEWLEQASQQHEVYCHDLEVMSLNPSWVELEVRSTSVPSRT